MEHLNVITTSIVLSASQATIFISVRGGDFEVFCPTGVTCCTNVDEIWRGEMVDSCMPNFTAIDAWIGVWGQKREFFSKF